jgi:hypothetical protein
VSQEATVCPNCGHPFKEPQGTRTSPVAWGCLILIIVFVVIVIVSFSGRESASSSSQSGAPAQIALSSIGWSEVNEIYGLKSKKTDLQKDAEWGRFKGRKVKWTGEVSSIGDTFGTLVLQVKMNPETFASDLLIRMKEIQRSKALKYSRGDTITFVGILNDWGTLLPITLTDGEIIP